MAKTLNSGYYHYVGEHEPQFALKGEDLKATISSAARDGNNIELLKSFARGDFSDVIQAKDFAELMAGILFMAALQENKAVAQAVLESNPDGFSYLGLHVQGYDFIEKIHTELSGDSSDSL